MCMKSGEIKEAGKILGEAESKMCRNSAVTAM